MPSNDARRSDTAFDPNFNSDSNLDYTRGTDFDPNFNPDSRLDYTRGTDANTGASLSSSVYDHDKLIFRYKFSQLFMDNLYEFSKIHEHDDRNTFKEAWEEWLEENDEIVSDEITRLEALGYTGDILTKMFKSSRYYFRKKTAEKKAPKQRRTYVSVSQELIDSMDEFISTSVSVRPATSFVDFCNKNTSLLQEEVKCLYNKGLKDTNEIRDKIKKTYKNRYFTKMNAIL